jgi:hypothetical protein
LIASGKRLSDRSSADIGGNAFVDLYGGFGGFGGPIRRHRTYLSSVG